jgi:hypothetical protein
MNAKQLEKIGTAIFPTKNWKARMADILGVESQTVYRWAKGEYPVPEEYHKTIFKFAEKQGKAIENALYDLRGFKK